MVSEVYRLVLYATNLLTRVLSQNTPLSRRSVGSPLCRTIPNATLLRYLVFPPVALLAQ